MIDIKTEYLILLIEIIDIQRESKNCGGFDVDDLISMKRIMFNEIRSRLSTQKCSRNQAVQQWLETQEQIIEGLKTKDLEEKHVSTIGNNSSVDK